jgi:ATP synthase protein I
MNEPAADPTSEERLNEAVGVQVKEVSGAMLRGGLIPAVVVAVVVVVLAGVLAGGAAVGTAVFGAAVALVVCALGPLTMRWTASSAPVVVMGIAMISLVTKLAVLAVLLIVLDRLELVDTRVFALALGPVALVFVLGETVAFARAKIPTLAT